MIGREELKKSAQALSFRLNATLLLLLLVSCGAFNKPILVRLLSPRFVPFRGRLSKDTYLLHWLFTSSPVFSPLFASFQLSRCFYLYLRSSDIQAQHFHPPPSPRPTSSLPCCTSSVTLLYLLASSSILRTSLLTFFARVLFHIFLRHSVSSSPLVHS